MEARELVPTAVPVPVAATVAGGGQPMRQCRDCNRVFQPALGVNLATRQGMRCNDCNKEYDNNFFGNVIRGSCSVQ